jgi:hypothetical protein
MPKSNKSSVWEGTNEIMRCGAIGISISRRRKSVTILVVFFLFISKRLKQDYSFF